ncbi:MAG TPA: DUF6716 putative glycosyltransferase [Coriobacteriia bacterium]
MDRDHRVATGTDGGLHVVFVGGFDSTNYAYVELVRELTRRGHRATVVVEDERDTVNNKMFASANIPVVRLSHFPLSALAGVDMAVSGPFVRERTKALFDAIHSRGIFLVSLANLFSSVTMWTSPDLVLTASEAKFAEFQKAGLAYSMVAVGNPQYDPLVRARAARPRMKLDDVRSVLVVDQGAYPLGPVGKTQLAQTLVALAVNNPRITFNVKPRYVPGEGGEHLHSVADHLYAYLGDTPDNLVLMREPSILEEVVLQHDAMITTWSTAHLDAVALGMPLLLIEGLDSVDAFDVRRQRVAAAYEHLRSTGCVVDWRRLQVGTCPFGWASAEYVAAEFYDIDAPCAPRVVELMEAVERRLLGRGRFPARGYQLSHLAFMERIDTLDSWELGSLDERQNRQYDRSLNSVAQQLAFEDRVLGGVLDLSGMLAMWDRRVTGGDGQGVDRALHDARELARSLKAQYFAAHPDLVASDAFVQDAYFDWLLDSGKRDELASYAGPVVAPQSLAFDLGMAELRARRFPTAARRLTESFGVSLLQPLPILKKDKNIRTLLSRADHSLAAIAALLLLHRGGRAEALASLDVPPRAGMGALLYYRMRGLVELGRPSDARAAAAEYAAATCGQAPVPGRGIEGLVMSLVRAVYAGRVRRLTARL